VEWVRRVLFGIHQSDQKDPNEEPHLCFAVPEVVPEGVLPFLPSLLLEELWLPWRFILLMFH